jgi:DNA/RNA endonuclease YhcR with UshA esterase domain
MKHLRFFLLSILISASLFAQEHILITEFVVTPTDGEFIEITNPTQQTIDLSNYYITDATSASNGNYYYNIVTGSNAGNTSSDFHARFPDGATIAPGEFQTIAFKATSFSSVYGANPTYELIETDPSVTNMREALPGSIAANAGLSNAGEVVILYFWDGTSDLVKDVDYVVWGDKAEAVDKSGVSIDGPDPDTTPSTYLNDTPIASQIPVLDAQPHTFGESAQRLTLLETDEITSGGNGIAGHDETSENLAVTFTSATPNPGSGPSGSGNVAPLISNIQRVPLYPFPGESVSISAEITDDGSVAYAALFVSTDGSSFDSTLMSSSGNIYTASIAGQNGGTTVSYFIKAVDNDGESRETNPTSYTIPAATTPIADIQANPTGFNTVLVEGVVTLGAGITITTRTDAYIQDASGRGINIFSTDAPDPLLERGNRVQIIGRVTEFNGVTEIVDYSIRLVSTNNPIPAPLVLTTLAAQDIALEGTYIRSSGEITNISVGTSGSDITINDGSGDLPIRIWNSTGIDISGLSAGDTLTVTAVMDIFNSSAQLIPGYQDELVEGTLNNPPVISNILQTPATPTSGNPVNISADITDDSAVAAAWLIYSVNNGAADSTAMSNSGGTRYAADIPAQPAGAAVSYFLKAIDDDSAQSVSESFEYTVIDPQLNTPPTISSVTQSPAQPEAGQQVQVVATISDDGAVPVRRLFYNVNGAAFDSTSMNFIGLDRYVGFIPGQNSEDSVSYFVKAVDDSGAVAISDTFSYVIPGADITPIAQIQANPSAFTTVTIEGIVTLAAGTTITTRTDAYVQDESGRGINIFSADPPDPLLARGNRVRITGTVEEFQGVTEITNYTIQLISTDNPLPAPLVLTTSGAGNTDLEGTYVQTSGLITDIATFTDATNIVIDDGSGGVLVRVWGSTGIDVSSFTTGQSLTVTAVMDIFSGAAQLTPSVQSELSSQISGNRPPVISNVSHTPALPRTTENVTVSADVVDDSNVNSVKLLYSLNSAAFDSVSMSNISGSTYQAEISAQPEGTQVAYFIKATDDSGAVSLSPTRTFIFTDAEPGEPHLLITEIAVVPTDGEFVEIFNPTNQTIDLSDYYLTDATFAGGNTYYYNIVTGTNAGGGDFGDFHARFPDGATIAPNEVQIIAMNGSGFLTTYPGVTPTYELYETDSSIPNMREALPGSINNQGGLTNSGEVIILYYWDGTSDLVKDVDYVVWGDKAEGIDKSGVSIDGPDADNTPSTYLNDTPIANQISVSPEQPHQFGETIQRLVILEYDEISIGGNGITGHDETSENLAQSFKVGTPNPGEVALPGAPVIEDVTFSPAEPTANEAVTISATAIDADGSIASVVLQYAIDSGPQLETPMSSAGGNTFTAQIPGQPNSTLVQFSIVATDNEGKTASSSGHFYVVGAQNGIIPIATIQNNAAFFEGQQVTIEGVVTLGAGVIVTTRVDAYIQDESGKGINVFDFNPPTPSQNLDRFKKLRISGTITEFGGVTEITNFTTTLIAESAPLPAPRFVRSGLANDLAYEGTYTKVIGRVDDLASNVGGGTNITLRDEQGTVLVRVWDITNIDLSGISIGDTIAVQGVADVFNNAIQIVPAYPDEITIPGRTARADGSGLVQLPRTTVQPDSLYPSFVVNIIGNIDDTVRTVAVEMPSLWGQAVSKSATSNQITAQAFLNGAEISSERLSTLQPLYSQPYLQISDIELKRSDTLSVVFKDLLAPSQSLESYFWVRTAGKNGQLRLTERPGKVIVGTGGRQLIYDLQTDSKQFSQVNINGIVTIGVGLLRVTVSSGDSVTSAYIQDESRRGIQLFRFGWDTNIQRGNLVQINGSVTEFNGVTEVEYNSSTLLAEEQLLPEPLQLTNRQVNSPRWDGTLIATEGVIIEKFSAGGGTTLEISDGGGTTNIRVWDTARLNLDDFNVNDRILVEGVAGLFISNGDSIYQLLTTYQDQIRLDPNYAPSLENVSLSVEPHPFVPDRGETIDITYNTAAVNNHITIRIFDMGGRMVATLLDETATLVEQTFTWNGRDELNELVPLGTYICHLEVVEPISGKKKSKMAPIVVGTVLR